MNRILIAPDSFKGTLSAIQVCDIIGKAFEDTFDNIEITKLPVADGGEGLCSCMQSISGGETIRTTVKGVFGVPMEAEYLMLPDKTAVIETASCAGLPLAGENKNPALATTEGVGELLLHAAANGAKSVLLGLGGSATNDCGTGLARALGFRFYDENGKEVVPTGGNLSLIRKIKSPDKPFPLPVTAACDVENPLYGEKGAAFVFAPQKGADAEMVKQLDEGLRSISAVIRDTFRIDVSDMKGAGAAGGLGAGSVIFLGARLRKGIDIILDRSGFDEKASAADLIITGEGRLDSQSVDGKVISGVASRGSKAGRKVITICGCRGEGAEKITELGVAEMYFSCETPKPFDEVVRTCRQDLYAAALRAAAAQ